jgi:RimJ/RimL family protein N-acetyltransferase
MHMICGKLVQLGPILPATDFASLFAWADDLDAARMNEPYRPAVWKAQEEFWFHKGNDPTRVHFAIREIGAAPIIGYAQIWNIDPVHRSAVIGLRIGDPVNRGQGFGSDALRLVVTYCWKHLNLTRIVLVVFATNERAIRLYAAHGFVTEGVLRQAVFIDGEWVDVVLMGLLHPARNPDASVKPNREIARARATSA